MSSKPDILAFAGSTREQSFNKKLLKIAVAGAESAGATVTVADLRDLPLPLFDGDLEEREGIPPNAMKLKALMKANQGFLLAAPEYNSGISGVLKNAIDWASRTAEGERPMECLRGKVVGMVSASPGPFGGVRGLIQLRTVLALAGVIVLPDQVTVPFADQAFDEAGLLKDAKRRAATEKVGATLAETLKKLAG